MKEYQIKWKMFNPYQSQYGIFEESEGKSEWKGEEETKMQLKGLRLCADDKKGKINRIWDIKVVAKSSQKIDVTSKFKE